MAPPSPSGRADRHSSVDKKEVQSVLGELIKLSVSKDLSDEKIKACFTKEQWKNTFLSLVLEDFKKHIRSFKRGSDSQPVSSPGASFIIQNRNRSSNHSKIETYLNNEINNLRDKARESSRSPRRT